MDETFQAEQGHFVEDAGILFESYGLPRMAGRIFGYLLICDPPYQGQRDLAKALGASMGSISTMTRLLQQVGLIERIGVPGDRRARFRIQHSAWTTVLEESLSRTKAYEALAMKGLELLARHPEHPSDRLDAMADFCAFFEEEFPGLMERWQLRLKKREAARGA